MQRSLTHGTSYASMPRDIHTGLPRARHTSDYSSGSYDLKKDYGTPIELDGNTALKRDIEAAAAKYSAAVGRVMLGQEERVKGRPVLVIDEGEKDLSCNSIRGEITSGVAGTLLEKDQELYDSQYFRPVPQNSLVPAIFIRSKDGTMKACQYIQDPDQKVHDQGEANRITKALQKALTQARLKTQKKEAAEHGMPVQDTNSDVFKVDKSIEGVFKYMNDNATSSRKHKTEAFKKIYAHGKSAYMKKKAKDIVAKFKAARAKARSDGTNGTMYAMLHTLKGVEKDEMTLKDLPGPYAIISEDEDAFAYKRDGKMVEMALTSTSTFQVRMATDENKDGVLTSITISKKAPSSEEFKEGLTEAFKILALVALTQEVIKCAKLTKGEGGELANQSHEGANSCKKVQTSGISITDHGLCHTFEEDGKFYCVPQSYTHDRKVNHPDRKLDNAMRDRAMIRSITGARAGRKVKNMGMYGGVADEFMGGASTYAPSSVGSDVWSDLRGGATAGEVGTVVSDRSLVDVFMGGRSTGRSSMDRALRGGEDKKYFMA